MEEGRKGGEGRRERDREIKREDMKGKRGSYGRRIKVRRKRKSEIKMKDKKKKRGGFGRGKERRKRKNGEKRWKI